MRFAHRLASIDRERWPKQNLILFGLTYHNEWPPLERVYEDFRKWDWRLQYDGFRLPMMWVKEVQKRGAPHFHGIAFCDESPWALDDRGCYVGSDLMLSMQRHWYRVAGHGSPDHAIHGTDLQMPKSWDGAGAYLSKYLTKPDDDLDQPTGRMWGVLRPKSIAPAWENTSLTQEEFYKLRRVKRRLSRRSKGRQKVRKYHGLVKGGRFLCSQKTLDRYVSFIREGREDG